MSMSIFFRLLQVHVSSFMLSRLMFIHIRFYTTTKMSKIFTRYGFDLHFPTSQIFFLIREIRPLLIIFFLFSTFILMFFSCITNHTTFSQLISYNYISLPQGPESFVCLALEQYFRHFLSCSICAKILKQPWPFKICVSPNFTSPYFLFKQLSLANSCWQLWNFVLARDDALIGIPHCFDGFGCNPIHQTTVCMYFIGERCLARAMTYRAFGSTLQA